MKYICPFCGNDLVSSIEQGVPMYICPTCKVMLNDNQKFAYLRSDAQYNLRESMMLLCLISVCKPLFVFSSKELFDEEFELSETIFVGAEWSTVEVRCVSLCDVDVDYLSGYELLYANGILADNLVDSFKCYISGKALYNFPNVYSNPIEFLCSKVMCSSCATSCISEDLVQAYFSPVLEGTVDSLFHIFDVKYPRITYPAQFLSAYLLGNQDIMYGKLSASVQMLLFRLKVMVKSVCLYATNRLTKTNTNYSLCESDSLLANPQIAINKPGGMWDPRFCKSMSSSIELKENNDSLHDKKLTAILALLYKKYLSGFEVYGLSFKKDYIDIQENVPDNIIQYFWYTLSRELEGDLYEINAMPIL